MLIFWEIRSGDLHLHPNRSTLYLIYFSFLLFYLTNYTTLTRPISIWLCGKTQIIPIVVSITKRYKKSKKDPEPEEWGGGKTVCRQYKIYRAVPHNRLWYILGRRCTGKTSLPPFCSSLPSSFEDLTGREKEKLDQTARSGALSHRKFISQSLLAWRLYYPATQQPPPFSFPSPSLHARELPMFGFWGEHGREMWRFRADE